VGITLSKFRVIRSQTRCRLGEGGCIRGFNHLSYFCRSEAICGSFLIDFCLRESIFVL
jgi:hypothetical protein